MERPITGPMQFPGEIQPGVYLDRQTAELVIKGQGHAVLGEIDRAMRGIQPVQRARLEEHIAAVAAKDFRKP